MSEFEPVQNPEGESKEPTVYDLVEACREKLTEEQLEELSQMEFEEALGLVFSYLIESGVEDPDAYLKEKRILE